jgi:hypothetical protein
MGQSNSAFLDLIEQVERLCPRTQDAGAHGLRPPIAPTIPKAPSIDYIGGGGSKRIPSLSLADWLRFLFKNGYRVAIHSIMALEGCTATTAMQRLKATMKRHQMTWSAAYLKYVEEA